MGFYKSTKGGPKVHTSYADNLKFIKNKPHKDSVKTLIKLDTELDRFEINQMANFSAY